MVGVADAERPTGRVRWKETDKGLMQEGRCDSLSEHLGRLIQRQAYAIRSTSTVVGLSQRKYFDSVKYNDPPTLNHN